MQILFCVVLWIAFHTQAATCYIGITIFRKTNNSVSYSNFDVNIDTINLPVCQSANPKKMSNTNLNRSEVYLL